MLTLSVDVWPMAAKMAVNRWSGFITLVLQSGGHNHLRMFFDTPEALDEFLETAKERLAASLAAPTIDEEPAP